MSAIVDQIVSIYCDGCGDDLEGGDVYCEDCSGRGKPTVLRRIADELSALAFDCRRAGVEGRLLERLDAAARRLDDEAPAAKPRKAAA